ncbi:hypothetical protein CHELA20_51470 [Hyphomicrobiales bacterium]|nr:hypothetical protein CHELA20_51470 [Hyphomicrobiales bacterium]
MSEGRESIVRLQPFIRAVERVNIHVPRAAGHVRAVQGLVVAQLIGSWTRLGDWLSQIGIDHGHGRGLLPHRLEALLLAVMSVLLWAAGRPHLTRCGGGMTAAVIGVGFIEIIGETLAGIDRRKLMGFLPDLLDEAHAFLLQDALDTLDRVAFTVQQMADTAKKLDIIGAIVASPTTTLERLDLCETRFPETQDVLRNVEFFPDFADGAKGVWAFVHRLLLRALVLDSAGLGSMPEIRNRPPAQT